MNNRKRESFYIRKLRANYNSKIMKIDDPLDVPRFVQTKKFVRIMQEIGFLRITLSIVTYTELRQNRTNRPCDCAVFLSNISIRIRRMNVPLFTSSHVLE